jgi:hypothetical protein
MMLAKAHSHRSSTYLFENSAGSRVYLKLRQSKPVRRLLSLSWIII